MNVKRDVLKNRGTYLLLTLILILILNVTLIPYAHAEITDSDQDGVTDNKDSCLNTIVGDIFPLSTTNPDYLGCSCNQILVKLGNEQCYDMYCVDGKPLSISERIYSKDKISCTQDYCIDSLLYDFPEPQNALCSVGVPQEISCEPTMRRNSAECVSGEVPQYDDVQRLKEASEQQNKQPVQEPEQEFLKDEVYSILLDNLKLKNSLGIVNREDYQNKIISQTIITKQQKEITLSISNSSNASITENTLKIKPRQGTTLENAIVFERINLQNGLTKEDFIFQEKPETLSSDPWIIYWKIDEINSEKIITYRIRKQTQFYPDLLLLAQVKTPNVFWQIVPIGLIIFVVILMYAWFKRDITQRKIFK